MPRLFIAIGLPAEVKEELAEMAQGVAGARWTDPEQYHVTLRFLGDVGRDDFSALRERLAGVKGGPFNMRIKGVGHFPPRGEPATLWAGVEKSAELISLRNRVESLAVKMGFPSEPRKFFPHVTVAKVKGVRSDQTALFLQRHSLRRPIDVPVEAFQLYSSVLTSEGSVHAVEAAYGLIGGS